MRAECLRAERDLPVPGMYRSHSHAGDARKGWSCTGAARLAGRRLCGCTESMIGGLGRVQAEAAAEAKLKGPHAFLLERALATFWELRGALDEEPAGAAEQRDRQSGDLLTQISSLVAMRFLSQVRLCPSRALHAARNPFRPTCMHRTRRFPCDVRALSCPR